MLRPALSSGRVQMTLPWMLPAATGYPPARARLSLKAPQLDNRGAWRGLIFHTPIPISRYSVSDEDRYSMNKQELFAALDGRVSKSAFHIIDGETRVVGRSCHVTPMEEAPGTFDLWLRNPSSSTAGCALAS
jgi:hypothetical protein